ncbi:MAG: hypothetical protein SVM80_05160 [Halobacteriota archaeon]|nr:hypothetical protein [Halobacteriota archaeon]
MGEEKRCPVFRETILCKVPICDAKILRREPLLSLEDIVGQIVGPKQQGFAKTDEEEASSRYYTYECEKGHTLIRPEEWADVPKVPPGTIQSGRYGIKNTPAQWYNELPEEEKEKILK